MPIYKIQAKYKLAAHEDTYKDTYEDTIIVVAKDEDDAICRVILSADEPTQNGEFYDISIDSLEQISVDEAEKLLVEEVGLDAKKWTKEWLEEEEEE